MTTVFEVASRIAAIQFGADDRRGSLHVRLAREFLRRTALWAQALGQTDEWPFFDIAAAVDPSSRADPYALRRVEEHLAAQETSWYAPRICEWALHFAALPTKPDLPNPYEPLLILFERGGDFTTETGFMNIDYVLGLPMRSWRDHLSEVPVISLDAETLDAAEAKR